MTAPVVMLGAEVLVPDTLPKHAQAIDAFRVLALIRAIEARGAGHPLGEWLAMICGWDRERAFNAIAFATDQGWIAPSSTGKVRR